MLNKFCTYNNWANARLLDAMISSSAALPESCISLFSHIVNAQWIWTCRIRGIAPQVAVWQVNDLHICKELLEESVRELAKISNLDDPTVIKYTTNAGDDHETAVCDILLHVFNHGTYHRAQIAKEMRQHQLEPVSTDYIHFVRLGA